MRKPGSSSVLCTLVLAAVSLAAFAAAAMPQPPVVATAEGSIRGVRSEGIDRFLGIPYARAPVGDLRWRPPQAFPAWAGVREATQFANHCPQAASPYGLPSTTEDCLFLNVFTPVRADEGRSDDASLPVMVWIHGGALNLGESDDYDPAELVREGIVVVTINYRLGMLGFLSHPALSAESGYGASGNYGLMDQQLALRWVQRNVARFGDRVTPIQQAVWSTDGGLRIERGNGERGEWGIRVRPCAPGETPDVDAISITSLLARHGVDHIDLLKVDIEGAERDLFDRNASGWLRSVQSIIIEVHDRACHDAFFSAVRADGFDATDLGHGMAVAHRA